MADKKKVLGRGLSALLKNPETDITTNKSNDQGNVVGSVNHIPINQIEVNPFQPRTEFKTEALQELVASIQQLGIIQPLTCFRSRKINEIFVRFTKYYFHP